MDRLRKKGCETQQKKSENRIKSISFIDFEWISISISPGDYQNHVLQGQVQVKQTNDVEFL